MEQFLEPALASLAADRVRWRHDEFVVLAASTSPAARRFRRRELLFNLMLSQRVLRYRSPPREQPTNVQAALARANDRGKRVYGWEPSPGERRHHLVFVRMAETRAHHSRYVLVRCDCGVEKEMQLAPWKAGKFKACGCGLARRFRE